jgi:hypothetical protein
MLSNIWCLQFALWEWSGAYVVPKLQKKGSDLYDCEKKWKFFRPGMGFAVFWNVTFGCKVRSKMQNWPTQKIWGMSYSIM